MKKIERCPFCGGQSRIGTVKYPQESEAAKLNGRHIGYYVNCVKCGANNQGGLSHPTFEDAVQSWNERV